MQTLRFFTPIICSVGFLLLLVSGSHAQKQMALAMPKDTSFNAFLQTLEQANINFINGDPTLWKQLCSHSDDASILGGFGGYEKGWNEVGPRYNWASSQFKASVAKKWFEYISKIVSDNLAYTITIERAKFLLASQQELTAEALRVTQLYRKENGEWKLLHRHADPLLEKKAPSVSPQFKN